MTRPHSKIIAAAQLLLIAGLAFPVTAQERWFQIEVSIFSNESLSDRAEESWTPRDGQLSYPDNIQRLQRLRDILTIDALLADDSSAPIEAEESIEESNQAREDRLRRERIALVGPEPSRLDNSDSSAAFKYFDFARDSFVQLPASQSDFQQTNRTLRQSPDHRLLFHGLWRQAVENTPQAIPMHVFGGESYGDSHELEGSLTIRFNDNRDRVVIDADIWLTEYSTVPLPNSEWELPAPPSTGNDTGSESTASSESYFPVQVYHMLQSREMRSTEFHYLDHPALGIVVMVVPYELPILPPQGFSQDPVE